MIKFLQLSVIICGVGLAQPVFAESGTGLQFSTPTRITLDELNQQYKKSHIKRNIGIALAVPGLAISVIGGVVIGYGVSDPNLGAKANELAFGAVVSLAGLLLAGPGIAFWILGQDEMDNITWRRRQLTPYLSLRPGQGVGGFALSF